MRRILVVGTLLCVVESKFLELSSNGPAVLDSEISFSGQLGEEVGRRDIKWVWRDDSGSIDHFWETVTEDSLECEYRISYPAEEFEARKYRMFLEVFERGALEFWKLLGSAVVEYTITENLNGELNLLPGKFVSTAKGLNASLDLYDPNSFLKNASDLKYFWTLNDTNYGESSEPFRVFHLKETGPCQIRVFVVAKFSSNSTKYGNFSNDVVIKDPIHFLNATGDLWLKHGQILDLTLRCDGTGPWKVCWSIMAPDYNVTGNETCTTPKDLETECFFDVYWYFRNAGVHKVLAIAQNEVSKVVKLYEVTVYKVQSQTPVSFVVVPIMSLLGAIFAFIIALILVVKFKRRLAIETADFDFSIQDDDNLEYKTFWERLRDSMLNAFGNSSDDVSHISSSNSSSHGSSVKPPVGIHYGSIS